MERDHVYRGDGLQIPSQINRWQVSEIVTRQSA